MQSFYEFIANHKCGGNISNCNFVTTPEEEAAYTRLYLESLSKEITKLEAKIKEMEEKE